MKTFNVLHILLFILLMLVYQCSHAQDKVVTIKGDTIHGKLKILANGTKKEVSITTQDKKKAVYSVTQMQSFFMKGEKFKAVATPQGIKFMKVIQEGYLSLMGFQPPNQTSYDALYLLKKDGSGTEVPNLTFKKGVTKFLNDCPSIADQIDNGTLGKKDLTKIIDEYNACITNRTNNQTRIAATVTEQNKKISSVDKLEEKVKAKDEFEGKADALEMITDIKGKIKRGEKIPKFLIDGLRGSLTNAALTEELESALREINENL